VTGSYVNDALGSNQRYLTYQAEVSTPVWLPGQGRATVAAGQAEVSSLDAEGEALHLSLARQVLDAASQAALAENARTAAGRRLQAAQVLAADLNRRFRVGEAAQSDALAADADVANAAVTLADAAAQLAAAQATLAALTGSTSVPSLSGGAVAVPGLDALRQVHPRLVAARRLVDAAQSSLRLTRLDTRDSPEIGVQGIHEKQGAATPYNTRFGVVVRFPFATQARNAPRIAAAEAQVTAAEVQQVQAERQVLAELQSAQGALEAARQGSAAATRAAGSLTIRRGQIERAWRAGEMPLIEVLRANAVAFDAELVRDKSRTVLQASQQRLQIAAGLLP
ncbi:MAG: TolC family protein, partial [Janthinobacterium lividum]